MFRSKELLFIILVQAAITLILSSATPNRGIIHPSLDNQNPQPGFFHHSTKLRNF